jgi:hypothetical protein
LKREKKKISKRKIQKLKGKVKEATIPKSQQHLGVESKARIPQNK